MSAGPSRVGDTLAPRIPCPIEARMILPRYRVAPSRIPSAGSGLFLEEPVAAGRIIIAPDAIDRTLSLPEVLAHPAGEAALGASVRWFEDRYTVSLDWPDECYVNHSFSPTGLWHLGFVFASRDLGADEEVTVDYRHLLGEGQQEDFPDAETGRPIIGLPWRDALRASTQALARLL